MPGPACPYCKAEAIETHVLQGERLVSDGKLHCAQCKRSWADDKPAYEDPTRKPGQGN